MLREDSEPGAVHRGHVPGMDVAHDTEIDGRGFVLQDDHG